jgi:hypothetical protein
MHTGKLIDDLFSAVEKAERIPRGVSREEPAYKRQPPPPHESESVASAISDHKIKE